MADKIKKFGYGATYKHNGDLLPGREQLQTETGRDLHQAVLWVGVQTVALLNTTPTLVIMLFSTLEAIDVAHVCSHLAGSLTFNMRSLTVVVAVSMLAAVPRCLPTLPDIVTCELGQVWNNYNKLNYHN